MKKTLCMIVAFVMFFAFPTATFAAQTESMAGTLPQQELSIKDMFNYAVTNTKNTRTIDEMDNSFSACDVVLKNENGEMYDVEMFEYTPASVSDNDNFSKTFVYSTSAEYVTPRSSHSQTNSGWDSSISVYGFLTINYRKNSNNSIDSYLLTSVSGGWERDDHTVFITDRYVGFTCQYIMDMSQLTYKYPTADSFSYSTNYSVYVPDDNLSTVVGAVSIADLQHGSSSKWQLITRAMIVENDIGDVIF